MWSVNLPPHHAAGLQVLERGVGLAVAKLAAARAIAADALGRIAGPPQRLRSAVAPSGGEGYFAVEAAVEDGRRRDAAQLLAAIAENVVVLLRILQRAIVGLALAAGGAEITLFAFAAAANTRRVVWVVDGTEVAAYLAAATGNAGLIDAFVLGLLSLEGRLR